MTELIVGDPSEGVGKDGTRGELRVYKSGDHVLTFTGNSLGEMSVNETAGAVPYCECTLKGEQGVPFGVIAVDDEVELWVFHKGLDAHRLIRARIDFVELNRESTESGIVLLIQGRTAVSSLMDRPLRGEYEGPLCEYFTNTAARFGVVSSSRDVSDRPVRIWTDAQSAYGALRVIGASTAVLVEAERGGTLAFSPLSVARERAARAPVMQLDASQILSMHYKQGVRLRDV